jgi:hypothetical protein
MLQQIVMRGIAFYSEQSESIGMLSGFFSIATKGNAFRFQFTANDLALRP